MGSRRRFTREYKQEAGRIRFSVYPPESNKRRRRNSRPRFVTFEIPDNWRNVLADKLRVRLADAVERLNGRKQIRG